MAANLSAVRRLRADLARLRRSGNPQISVQPSGESMLEWHFVLHDLPDDTPYAGGQYHGMLKFPEQYPLAPPSLVMLTPSGRLSPNTKLCLSMTDAHPETWNPAWTIESILLGLISFMLDPSDPWGVGALRKPAAKRRQFAASSQAFNERNPVFKELFPELVSEGGAASSSAPAEEEQLEDPGCVAEPAPSDSFERPAPGGGAASSSGGDFMGIVPSADGGAAGSSAAADAGGAAASRYAPQSPSEADVNIPALGDDGTQEEVQECWICREGDADEPLIMPCACRGSMCGVHASCVSAWVHHHVEEAGGRNERPRCSVCGQLYSGTNERLGVGAYVLHVAADMAERLIRCIGLVLCLWVYWRATRPGSIDLRLYLFIMSGSFFIWKSLVLSVSLLPTVEPDYILLRCLFHCLYTEDKKLVCGYVAETLATVVTALVWCAGGQIEVYHCVPLLLLVFVPALSVFIRLRGHPCTGRNMRCILLALASPLFGICYLMRLIWAQPWRLVDFTDAPVHCLVPVVASFLVCLCSSHMPALVLWAVHSGLLFVAVLERLCCRQIRWKQGWAWWVFVQLSALVFALANSMRDMSWSLRVQPNPVPVLLTSFLWFLFCCSAAISVNFQILMNAYTEWMDSHGVFTISGPVLPQTIGASGEEAAQNMGASGDEAAQNTGTSADEASAPREPRIAFSEV